MPGRHRLQEVQVQRRHLVALVAQALDRFLDRALGAAPADDQQVALVVAEHRRRLQRLLQRRELEAARAQAFLVDLGVVGDVALPVVREAGERVHAAGLPGMKRRARPVSGPSRRACAPAGIGLWSIGGASQASLNCGRGNGGCEVASVGVGEHHHHHVEGLGDLARGDDRVEAVLDRARRDHDLGRIAVAAEHRGQQVALLGLGRLAGARAAALHVDDDQRDLAHHREADRLLLERVARAGGDRDRALAGVGRADRERAGGDLVLGLVHDAADLLEHVATGNATPRSPA